MLRQNPVTSWAPTPVLPSVDSTACVDETAVLVGAVTIGPRAFVCPYAVLRADEGFPIVVGEACNIQDGVIVHALKGSGVEIGPRVSLAHGAVVHGPCTIGPGTFVGFRAVLLKTCVGAGCFIGHGALVLGVDLPDHLYVPPGTILTRQADVANLLPVPEELRAFAEEVVEVNLELGEGYRGLDPRKVGAFVSGEIEKLEEV